MPDHPNVVVFFTDQQRWDTVGAYDDAPMDLTPRLDEAAAEGTLLENAISSQPVCGPTRACLQTGQYGTTHGAFTNGRVPEAERSIAAAFNDADYETGYVGKWHLANTTTEPVPAERRLGYEDYWRAADALEHTSHPYEGVVYDGDGEPVEFDGYRVDALTDMAIEFVEQEREDPFFLTLSQLEPHHQNDMETYVAPDGYDWEYREPWVPPDLEGHPGDWYQELPDYYGICRRLDECYGRLLDALEGEGILEETIVLFVSDHGCHFRTRNGEYKRSCHEASVRVPAVIRGPGFEDGRIEEPVSLVDLPPTLLDGAGLEVPDTMEGDSLASFDGAGWKDEVFIQISEAECGRAIRTDRWKYAVYDPEADGGSDPASDRYVERYLYDLRADPYEQVNLIGRSDHADVAAELRGRLLDRVEAVEGERPAIEPAGYHA